VAESEEEELEALKNWWSENGNSLVIGIVVALTAVFGYRAWDNSVIETAEAASAMYEDLASSVADQPAEALSAEVLASVRSIGDRLKIEHGDSVYADFGALFLARLAVDKREFDTAEAELRWVLDNDPEPLEVITRMRLARVLAAQDRVDEALLVLVTTADTGEHQTSWDELRGDLFYQAGRLAEAQTAYQQAVDGLSEERPKPLLQMKLEDLVDASTPVAATE
jgi:predicted negative regulator of RcsB-dependent stress response